MSFTKGGNDPSEKDLEKLDSRTHVPSRWSRYRLFLGLALGYGLLKATVYSSTDSNAASRGWTDHTSRSQGGLSGEKAEELFLSIPDPQSALAASRRWATHPHLASSDEDFQDSKDFLKVFQDELGITPPDADPIFPAGSEASRSATLGIQNLTAPAAWIDVYYPIMNTPLDRSLQIIDKDGKPQWEADLVEDGDPLDPEAAKYRDYIPTWHGFSKNGTADGQLIYADYGRQEDYDELEAQGVNFTDKVVLVRYGYIYRGLKVKGAEERGAAAVLIYTDLRDDGIVTFENGYEPYPHGPARNPTSVQRGSVQYISYYPGDPTTPGYPAYENATRTEATNIPKIPSLPISWENAEVLLKEISSDSDARVLNGRVSERKVKLVNHVDNHVMPIYNAMAVIPGHIRDETVIVGCHRDAWVLGAADPTSGAVSLREIARGYGALLKQGWKPLRNIIIANWDAEEYGLVGSTEWGEDFSEWIQNNVVAYLNTDVSAAGSVWNPSASPSLAHAIKSAALAVPHPTKANKTLWDARNDLGPYTNGTGDAAVMHAWSSMEQSGSLGIEALGSGSDFTVFLQRLGIASMDEGFGGTPFDAVYHYHSIYDSQRWEELYADPGFYKHVAVARHLGLVALRIADAVVVPLNTTEYTLQLDVYLDEIEDLAKSLLIHSSVDFKTLRHAIRSVQSSSAALDIEKAIAEDDFKDKLSQLPKHAFNSVTRWWYRYLHQFFGWTDPIEEFIKAAKRVQRVNARLRAFEGGFLDEEGIKDREWYRHLGVAPGKWLGYGATTLPSIYDALVYENATYAQHEVDRVARVTNKLAKAIKP